ncbi:MAG TPA: hypothetical protein VHU82_12120 [Vicinamibacterales bacterium]|nr:hypothetical protein [Vicinamibacterales bacterium]
MSLLWMALSFTIAIASGSSPSSSPRAYGFATAPNESTSQATQAGAFAAKGLAPQPGPAYGLILGPSSIDDGLSSVSDAGHAVANALSAVADLFGSGDSRANASSAQSTAVTAAKDLDATISPSEYDIVQLAKTLPDDPDVLYRFVTDRITVDGYDGVMRGPLVTWMSRAGSPTDKTVLLAWLLVTKNIPYQFVRGSLSAAERVRIANVAASPAAAVSVDPRVASYTAALEKDGGEFAKWARGLLSARSVELGGAKPPADRLSPRHYWIQIARNNAIVDLDPTLPGSAAGTHLGTIDSSFKPTGILPSDEWHYVQIRVTASFANNATKTLLDHTDTVPNLAYAPIRIVFAPSGSVDPMQPGTATAFELGLQIGSTVAGRSHVDLGTGPTALQSVVLEVLRKGPDGVLIEVARRSLVDAHTPAADRAYRLAGMTTMLVAPGRGAMAFATHTQFRALQQLAQDTVDAASGAAPAPHPWYPIRIIDYYRRDDAMADALASAQGARLYRDRPDVAMLRTAFVRNGTATNVMTAFDIADNGMGSMATQSDAVVKENMIRGYADTRIEHDVLETPSGAGTIALFAAASAQSVPPSVLTQRPQTTDDLHEGLDQTFTAGQVAIAPSNPVRVSESTRYGWWAIDPRTGNSVGRMTGGAGQDMAEESVIINTISKAYTLYGQLQAGATCAKSGFGSVGCIAAVCASVTSYIFGGNTVGQLASNYAAGQMASAGCNGGFGAK